MLTFDLLGVERRSAELGTPCGFTRQIDLVDFLGCGWVWHLAGCGLVWLVGRTLLWIYETDRFVGFVGSSWVGQGVLWC